MFKGLWVMVAMAATDYFYTCWILAVKASEKTEAGLFAAILICCTAFVTTSYVENKVMIVPAAIGAFIGTVLAML